MIRLGELSGSALSISNLRAVKPAATMLFAFSAHDCGVGFAPWPQSA